MRIIPAIDIIDGRCVRLSKGDYSTKKIYNENPVEVAKEFEANGIRYLHLVDLDGAKSEHIVNHKVLSAIATNTNLIIDFGGGLKKTQDLDCAFENGAKQVTIGSIAATSRAIFLDWLNLYGADKIILGADCINGKIASMGWQDVTDLDIIEFIKNYEVQGVKNVICTDVAKDGMLQGTSNELYANILAQVKINLIASGGVSCLQDIYDLKMLGCEGVIIGKAIYEGKITLNELSELC